MFNFFSRDVSTIVGKFESLAKQLETAMNFHTLRADVHTETIKVAEDARTFSIQEANRAKAVAIKLRALIA